MLKALRDGLVGLAGSKKFLAAFLAAVCWGVGKLGLELDAEEVYPMVVPMWVFILAQMGADWKKAAALIAASSNGNGELEAPKPEEPTPE
jgi:hypothetical protein